MKFRDEFEHILNDKSYYIYIQGETINEDGYIYNKINEISAFDDAGNPITEEDDEYSDLFDAAENHEYDIEVHGATFDNFYEHQDSLEQFIENDNEYISRLVHE